MFSIFDRGMHLCAPQIVGLCTLDVSLRHESYACGVCVRQIKPQ